jgi:hypothetical protein
MINIFDENYNTNYIFDNNQSMFDFNRDDKDYSQKYLNDELFSFDQSIEIKNRKMIDLWNDGKGDDNVNQIQEKTTAFKTNNKNNKKCYSVPLKLLENVKVEEDKSPKIFSFIDIKETIFKNDVYKAKFLFDVNNMFIDKKLESKFINKKRFRDINEDNFLNEFMENEKIENNEQEGHKKRGRKPKKIKGYKVHDKMTSDNIIKKIKAEFFKYMVLFINNIIGTINLIYKNKIYKIDYELINRLNREIDLKYLNMTIKDLMSLNVSPKYKKVETKSNKNYIEKILNEKFLTEAIKFALNMTFRDFIDIFTYKKKVKDLLNEYKVNDYNNVICNKIEKSLVGVDDLFNKIAKSDKNDKNYFSNFVFYLYNYEKWFFMKRGRNKRP